VSTKKEIEAAAIAMIRCPSCGAAPGKNCRTKGVTTKGRTHQRRLSKFVAEYMKEN